jgi:hypothetical protein
MAVARIADRQNLRFRLLYSLATDCSTGVSCEQWIKSILSAWWTSWSRMASVGVASHVPVILGQRELGHQEGGPSQPAIVQQLQQLAGRDRFFRAGPDGAAPEQESFRDSFARLPLGLRHVLGPGTEAVPVATPKQNTTVY